MGSAEGAPPSAPRKADEDGIPFKLGWRLSPDPLYVAFVLVTPFLPLFWVGINLWSALVVAGVLALVETWWLASLLSVVYLKGCMDENDWHRNQAERECA